MTTLGVRGEKVVLQIAKKIFPQKPFVDKNKMMRCRPSSLLFTERKAISYHHVIIITAAPSLRQYDAPIVSG